MSHTKLFLVPETRPGKGTGHFRRAIDLAVRHPDAYIYLPENLCASWEHSFPQLLDLPHGSRLPEANDYRIVVDQPWLSDGEAKFWANYGPLIGIDVRGPGSARCIAIVDALPRIVWPKRPWERGNRQSVNFLNLLPAEPTKPASGNPVLTEGDVRSILVSFGGEDSFHQGRRLAESGLLSRLFPHATVTFVRGARMALPNLPKAWKVLDAPPELRKLLPNYDLVLTMFGLTAFECLAARVAVLLWNPTKYHRQLADESGFVSLAGRSHPRTSETPTHLLGLIEDQIQSFTYQSEDLGAAILQWNLSDRVVCPTCGSHRFKVVQRFESRTFKRCESCAMLSMTLLGDQPIAYTEQYFFDEYRAQYGKTYLDDFDHIRAMGFNRLRRIRPLQAKGRLLDIGCAYGPFLSAAKATGFQVAGVDLAEAAVNYVRKSLGIPAATVDLSQTTVAELCSLLPPADGPERYDVVTMWYVIEHFSDLRPILALLNRILKPGGVLAMGTPSGSGISARRNHQHFLARSPMDHYTVWEPRRTAGILKRYGFALRRTYGSGHHPERFGGWLGKTWARPLTGLISKWGRYADTFEIYVQKIGELD